MVVGTGIHFNVRAVAVYANRAARVQVQQLAVDFSPSGVTVDRAPWIFAGKRLYGGAQVILGSVTGLDAPLRVHPRYAGETAGGYFDTRLLALLRLCVPEFPTPGLDTSRLQVKFAQGAWAMSTLSTLTGLLYTEKPV
jgi:hypothetical protein